MEMAVPVTVAAAPAALPEPASVALFGLALGADAWRKRTRRR